MKIIRYKTFSKYDSTDRLKKMKDSDILEEEYKKTPGVGFKEVTKDLLTGAVIGAGAVVTHDISENAVAVGAPAREIKKR
jgi:hypothetical protein